jgi:hypothetical protein
MLPELGAIGAVAATLKELNVEDKTIRDIVEILEESAGDLKKGELGTLNPAHLGGSSSGALLGYHTSVAHRHVVEAMQQMVLGLRGYQANVQKFHKDIDFVDEDSGAASTRTTGKVNGIVPTVPQSDDCAQPDDFNTNDQCTIPGGN